MEHELVKLILALPWPVHVANILAILGYGCAIAAALLPQPEPDAHVAWKVARKVIDAFAFNFNHAKNEGPLISMEAKHPVTAGQLVQAKVDAAALKKAKGARIEKLTEKVAEPSVLEERL